MLLPDGRRGSGDPLAVFFIEFSLNLRRASCPARLLTGHSEISTNQKGRCRGSGGQTAAGVGTGAG